MTSSQRKTCGAPTLRGPGCDNPASANVIGCHLHRNWRPATPDLPRGARPPVLVPPAPLAAQGPFLEVPDMDDDLDPLLEELGARLAATPPIVVGTPYGRVTFTVVPPKRPLPDRYLDDDLGDYAFTVRTSGQLRVGRHAFEADGSPGEIHQVWCGDDTLDDYDYAASARPRYPRLGRVPRGSSKVEAAAAALDAWNAEAAAWEDDATLELRHLLRAAETAHVMRLNAKTVVWSAADDWDEDEHDQLRRELLLVTADGLDGDERKAAHRVAENFHGTSRELVEAVRAILAPRAR